MTLMVDDAEEVFNTLTEVVSELEEDDQSEDNLGLIAEVFDQIDDLIRSGSFNVTNNVS